jgi:hypothetical protein
MCKILQQTAAAVEPRLDDVHPSKKGLIASEEGALKFSLICHMRH